MHITYSTQARKMPKKMPKKIAQQILTTLEKVAKDPRRRDVDITKLKGREGYRIRVGDWRVIYTQDGQVLHVVCIATRGDAYK